MEKKALGRGLSSLLPASGREVSKDYFHCLVEDILPNHSQPRKLFDREKIEELAASIAEKGVLQPLIVRSLGGGKYELIAGERRYRAAKHLGLEKVPVILKETDAQESLELALIENIQREDLNPIEESLAYRELINLYQYTHDELAKRVGKDRSSIANSLRLLKLPEEIRGMITSGKLSMGHARALLGIESRSLQIKMAQDIIEKEMSVREVESWIRELKEDDSGQEASVVQKVATIGVNPFREVQKLVQDRLQTRVLIKGKNEQGKIVIHFHSRDELSRILERIQVSS
jgi:ParB family chromosome partitioning protein